MKRTIAELNRQNAALYEALEAATAYIDASPCDPDIYPEQIAAWKVWTEHREALRTYREGERE